MTRRDEEFERHWRDAAGNPIPAAKLRVAEAFLRPLVAELSSRAAAGAPAAVLDVGCGDGVHACVLDDPGVEGSRFVGADIAEEAVRAARRQAGPHWEFVQADALRLPFDDGSFDACFSFGAIAYTGDAARAFAEMCRVTRPGGLVGLWVCPPHRGVAGALFGALRRLCHAGGAGVTRLVADAIVPALGLMRTRSGLHLGNASWRQCREVVLVNLAPEVLAFPDRETVAGWLDDHGVQLVEEDTDAPVTIWGRKTC